MNNRSIPKLRFKRRRWIFAILAAGALVLGACTGDGGSRAPGDGPGGGMPMSGDGDGPSMMEPGSGPSSEGQAIQRGETGDGEQNIANGERLYFTATNQAGERIPYQGGPDFGGMMMGTYLTCASCHGPEGRGGEHVMHMQVMDAPDIRYQALSGESQEHAEQAGDDHTEEESGDHAEEHEGYALEEFRMAVVKGQHPDGEPLNRNMPRWDISDSDLADLFAFLKSIP